MHQLHWSCWLLPVAVVFGLIPITHCAADEINGQHVGPFQEMPETTFLDLVDRIETDGLVLITARSAGGVEAQARSRGLSLPALGYWSPEGRCFSKATTFECSGIFRP